MALWKFTNYNKHGHLRSRIMSTPGNQSFSYNPAGLGQFVGVSRFHYESRTPYHGVLTSPVDGKKYLTPDWIEVHPDTTLADIIYNAPKPEKEKPTEWLFESSSDPSQFYKVRFNGIRYNCSCPGSWRAKDRECKHIKQVKNG